MGHSASSQEALSPRRSFATRVGAALRLEPALYEEIEHDPHAIGQATAVVALAGLAGGIGALGIVGPTAIVVGVLSAFVAWLVWTAIVWLVGVKLFEHTSDFEELLRTLGFVAAPQFLYVFAVIPVAMLQTAIGLVVLVLSVIAFVRAVRQALDVDLGRAIFLSVFSVAIYWLLAMLFFAVAS